MQKLIDLFLTFAKIGMFTFGGGYAMISMIESYCVEAKKWLTHDEMMNITVIAESTPGPIAINCATYVGYKQAGFLGSIIATLGIIFPSFVIIFLIAKFLTGFLDIPLVSNAFTGIKLAAGLLIINAGVNMLLKMHKNKIQIAIIIFAFIMILAFNISSVLLMIASAIAGLILYGGKK